MLGVSLRRPRRTLALVAAVVLAAAPGLLRLELRTDGAALLPPDDPAVRFDAEARALFGLRDPLMVVVASDHPDGIYNPATLARVATLSDALAALPGIGDEHVQSLASEKRLPPGEIDFVSLLEPLPTTAAELERLRRDVAAIDILDGTLVSRDGRSTAILVGVPGGAAAGGGDRPALYRAVRDVALAHAGDDRIAVVGAPAAEAQLGEHVLGDLALLLPAALLVIALVLWRTCGGWGGALAGLAKVGAAQAFTFGLIGWSGQPVYLTTAVIPVLLTTIGLADEIHLLWSYRRWRRDLPAAAALRTTCGELRRPILLTSVTTSVGFLSFLGSSIPPVRSFGLFTAAGVLFCLFWAQLATPALLALHPDLVRPAGAAGKRPRLPRALRRLPGRLAAGRRWALPALALLTAVAVAGLPRLQIQDGWIANFAPGSELRRASERVDRDFAGTHVLQAVVRFAPPADTVPAIPIASGPLLDGTTVAALGRFEDGLRRLPAVGGVLGLASQLRTTAYLWGGRREDSREIVDNPAWIYLHVRRIGNVRGQQRRRELVDDAFERTVVTLLLERGNYRDTRRVMEAVRELERRELAAVFGHVRFAGDVAVSQAMIPAIVRTQVGSLGLALAASLLVLSLLFRSPLDAAVCLAPTLVAVLWAFGLMGWLGIPLGVATSMFCAVTLGIGVDYGIHLLARFRALAARGHADAAVRAVRETRPAILIDTVAIGLGFGLLALSAVPTNHLLGLLVAFGLASASLLTLAGLGPLLARLGHRAGRPARRGGDDAVSSGLAAVEEGS